VKENVNLGLEEVLYLPLFIDITDNNSNKRNNLNIGDIIYNEILKSKTKF